MSAQVPQVPEQVERPQGEEVGGEDPTYEAEVADQSSEEEDVGGDPTYEELLARYNSEGRARAEVRARAVGRRAIAFNQTPEGYSSLAECHVTTFSHCVWSSITHTRGALYRYIRPTCDPG